MKLSNYDPRWLIKDGRRVGFVFISPANSTYWQSCFFEHTKFGDQVRLFTSVLPLEESNGNIQPCKSDFAWTCHQDIESVSFDEITVTPSLDGSAGGLWHGFIANGEIA